MTVDPWLIVSAISVPFNIVLACWLYAERRDHRASVAYFLKIPHPEQLEE